MTLAANGHFAFVIVIRDRKKKKIIHDNYNDNKNVEHTKTKMLLQRLRRECVGYNDENIFFRV